MIILPKKGDKMGRFLIYIIIFAIWAIMRRVANVRVKETKEQEFKLKSRAKALKLKSDENDSKIKYLKKDRNRVEKNNHSKVKTLGKKEIKNEILIDHKKRNNLNCCTEDIFLRENLLNALILKEILDPPKAISKK